MPCDQVMRVSVEFKVQDSRDVGAVLTELREAGDAGCWRIRYNATTQALEGDGRALTQERIGRIKKEVAKRVVRRQAKRMGWKIIEKGDKLTIKR